MTDADLLAYLNEALPLAEMTRVEHCGADTALVQRLAVLAIDQETGGHSLSDIWRRHRLSCPNRSKLGAYLLDALEDSEVAYIRFHLDEVGCRLCRANLVDLQGEHSRVEPATTGDSQPVVARRRRYFESSVGRLSRQ